MAKTEGEEVKLNRDQMQRLVDQANAQKAAMPDVPQDEKPKAPPVQLSPERIDQAEFRRNLWVATAPFGTTIEQVRDESFFSHVAAKLKPYDHIEVRTDSGEWIAELLVTEAGRNWTRTYLLSHHRLTTSDIARTMSNPTLEVTWKGPHLLFCVIRKSDSAILQDKMPTEEGARAWIRNRESLIGT